MGYYFCYFDENTSSAVGQGGQGFAGGMVGIAPTAGLLLLNDTRLTYSLEARIHFMGNIEAEIFWSYLDIGFQMGVWLW